MQKRLDTEQINDNWNEKKGRKQPATTDFFVQMEIEISYGQFTCKP